MHKFRKGAIQDEERATEERQRTWRPALRRQYRRKDRRGDLTEGGCTEEWTDTETCWEEDVQKDGQTWRPDRRRLHRKKDRHGDLPGGGCMDAVQKEGQTQRPARRLWQQPNEELKVPWARTVTTKQGN